MPFQSSTFNVLIASPSDLVEERKAAREAIHDWNDLHAEAEGVSLLPIMWETHAMPEAGERPQGIINRQLVAKADLLIGLFWTKMGTDTGVAECGTVEEINQIVAAGKPAMLYFSTRPMNPQQIDVKQLQRLKAFREETYRRALAGTFASPDELRQTLVRDLTRRVRTLKKDSAAKDEAAKLSEWLEEADRQRTAFEQRLLDGKFYDMRGKRLLNALSIIPASDRVPPFTFSEPLLMKGGGDLRPIDSDHGGKYESGTHTLANVLNRGERGTQSATEITSRGRLFAARHWIPFDPDDNDLTKIIPPEMDYFEPQMAAALRRYLNLLRVSEVPGPYAVGITLLNATNVKLLPGRGYRDTFNMLKVFTGDHVRPDAVIFPADFDAETQAFMRHLKPALDQFWRGFGYLYGAASFDEQTGLYRHARTVDEISC